MTYQVVPLVVADLWCLGEDTPCESGGHGLDPEAPCLPASAFEVKERNTHHQGDLGVYAKVDVPQGSYIAPEETVQGIFVPPSTYQLLENASHAFDHSYWDCLFSRYLDRFGWTDDFYVSSHSTVIVAYTVLSSLTISATNRVKLQQAQVAVSLRFSTTPMEKKMATRLVTQWKCTILLP